MKTRRLFPVLFICFVFLAGGFWVDTAYSAQGNKAVFGSPIDISIFPVAKADIKHPGNTAAAQVIELNFQLDTAQCAIYSAPEGYSYFDAGDLRPTGRAGDPQLPMKTFVVELDKEAQVYGVELVKGKINMVQQEVNIVPMPEASTYSGRVQGSRYVPNPAVYGQASFFPGKLLKFSVGRDNDKQYVYIRVYPVQYLPNRKKLAILTEGAIMVYYGNSPAVNASAENLNLNPEPNYSASLSSTDSQVIILCPASLESIANRLRDFHISEGLTSTVVTTESIAAGYVAAGDPPYQGYKNKSLPSYKKIRNYNYTLAKQIVSYLNDTYAHPNLKFVTILGDALLVPPSYYYYVATESFHAAWVPTDYFYVSPDYALAPNPYDLTPNFMVGRLSVSDAVEAEALINKMIAWHEAAGWSWFRNMYLVGGDPHAEHLYCGEMNVVEPVNRGYLSGMNIRKCFESDGTHTKEELEFAIRDGNVGIVYDIDHGSGFGIGALSITSSDVLFYASATNTPVFISTGCDNGAFDQDLYPLGTPTSSPYFGEALLKSPAGAIAYFGGSRHNSGDALFYYDQGNVVVTAQTYCIGYYIGLLKSYSQGAKDLGQMYIDSVNDYIIDHDIDGSDPEAIDQLMMVVFLGDPALKIPAQQPAVEYSKALVTAEAPDSYDANDIPTYTGTPVNVTAATDAPSVKWKLIDSATKAVLEPNLVQAAPFYRTYQQSAQTQYLVRTSTPGADEVANVDYTKENWLLYSISGSENLMIHVADIAMSTKTAKNITATAIVTIVDAQDVPVSGVLVSGHWYGLTTDADSGITDGNGRVALKSDAVAKGTQGVFTFTVDNVEMEGAVYDPAANVMIENSIPIM